MPFLFPDSCLFFFLTRAFLFPDSCLFFLTPASFYKYIYIYIHKIYRGCHHSGHSIEGRYGQFGPQKLQLTPRSLRYHRLRRGAVCRIFAAADHCWRSWIMWKLSKDEAVLSEWRNMCLASSLIIKWCIGSTTIFSNLCYGYYGSMAAC